jgi:prepilin-type processing-associated H-X9-DG protein
VRQLGVALQLFVEENHVYPMTVYPSISYTDPVHTDYRHTYSYYSDWQHDLNHELGTANDLRFLFDQGVWKCPSAVRPNHRPVDLKTGMDLRNAIYESYGYNDHGIINLGRVAEKTNYLGLSPRTTLTNMTAVPVSAVVSPAEMIAIGDGFSGHDKIIWSGSMQIGRIYGLPNFFKSDTKEAFSRHQGRANVVFCDGHVESPTLKFLFEDASDEALSRWNRDNLPHRERLAP